MVLTKLKALYREWRDRRFLKRHGCKSWREYHYRFDEDCEPRASRVKDYYKGYPYVYCIEDHKHNAYDWDLGYSGLYIISEWCENNCVGKFRFNCLRVINYPSTGNEWEINEMGGGDYIFAAFKESKDYMMFLLRWA